MMSQKTLESDVELKESGAIIIIYMTQPLHLLLLSFNNT